MIHGAKRVEIADVEVLNDTDFFLYCRVGDEVVAVPSLRVLPGTKIKHRGDRGDRKSVV